MWNLNQLKEQQDVNIVCQLIAAFYSGDDEAVIELSKKAGM
jgi:hypothetical protein